MKYVVGILALLLLLLIATKIFLLLPIALAFIAGFLTCFLAGEKVLGAIRRMILGR